MGCFLCQWAETLASVGLSTVRMRLFALDILTWKRIAHVQSASVWTVSSKVHFLTILFTSQILALRLRTYIFPFFMFLKRLLREIVASLHGLLILIHTNSHTSVIFLKEKTKYCFFYLLLRNRYIHSYLLHKLTHRCPCSSSTNVVCIP